MKENFGTRLPVWWVPTAQRNIRLTRICKKVVPRFSSSGQFLQGHAARLFQPTRQQTTAACTCAHGQPRGCTAPMYAQLDQEVSSETMLRIVQKSRCADMMGRFETVNIGTVEQHRKPYLPACEIQLTWTHELYMC
jgi:hypothetical protein